MGLREKRAIEIVKDRDLPAVTEEISGYIGTSPTIEVAWDSLESAGEDAVFSVPGMGLRRIASVMLMASRDKVIKEAFAQQIKTVRLEHVAESAAKAADFADGTLTLKLNFADTFEGVISDQEIYDKLLDTL